MGLRDAIKSKSAGLVKRESFMLPEVKETVQVRGLMAGESQRCGEAPGFRQMATMLCLAVEDPATGKPIWNANVLEDVQEIEQMHPLDVTALVLKINELSGGEGKKAKALLTVLSADSATNSSSDSPSPSSSIEQFGS